MALSIKKDESSNVFVRMLKKFIGDKICIKVYPSVRGIRLEHLVYYQRRKNINWNRIEKLVGAEKSCLLCSYSALPVKLGFKKLDVSEYRARLSTNMLLYALSKVEQTCKLRIALYDPLANYSELLPYLTEYTDNITVITKEVDYYLKISQCIIEQTGACTQITRNDDFLCDYDIIISPGKITKRINTNYKALLFTGEKPEYPTSAEAFYNYSFRLPRDLESVKPDAIDNLYFAGALYLKGKMYNLGSIVPTLCSNAAKSHTISSLVKAINNMV